MVIFKKGEEAVSPVIGTVLMVAITVILASVIGTFVLGMPISIPKAKIMGSSVQIDADGDCILLSYHGGPDDNSLSMINITAPNGTIWYTSGNDGSLTISTASSPAPVKPEIGSVMKLYPAPDWPAGKKRILAIGIFNDGVHQVILDSYF